MKLLVIHGAAAVGKFTVATEVAKRTGFKVFHNHLSLDLTTPVFEFGVGEFWSLNAKLRCEVIAAAARDGINLIHTFCYAKGEDDAHFRDLIAAAEDNGGEALTVLLVCDDESRQSRITSETRKRMGKLTDPASVAKFAGSDTFRSTLPGRETLVIDTTKIPPGESADRIIDHYKLTRLGADQADSPLAESPAPERPGTSSSK